jgi:hypothetical protein
MEWRVKSDSGQLSPLFVIPKKDLPHGSSYEWNCSMERREKS